jgi:uncharacterized YigZ family protein
VELPSGAYTAPARSQEGELRERKSRFLAFVEPVASAPAAEAALKALQERFPDASHHCWARRLGMSGAGPEERASDDGEPAGTAGLPILQVLRGAELSDVLAVVVRWFGGIKLGKGGLVRAYAEATRLALEGLPVVNRVPTERLAVELPYEHIGAVKRLVRPPQVELEGESYGERVRFVLRCWPGERGGLDEALAPLGLSTAACPAPEGSIE